MTELEQLEQGLAALEAQRPVLGDALVEVMLAPIREKIATLKAPAAPPATDHATDQQRKFITVLFADVSGFTSMSEVMDAEDVSETMNALWQPMDAIIVAHGGRIDKHIGDAVMAVWGGQAAREDDPERAIRAALAMQAALQKATSEGGTTPLHAPLAMRIGINSGFALLGTVGTTGEYTALGDTVNLAQRLESIAPIGGVLISHDTFRHVRGVFHIKALDLLRVKGRAEPVQTYLIRGAKPRAFRTTTRGVEGIETRMVGRDGELQQLQTAVTTMLTQGLPQVAIVIGDAGMGKSRLLSEFGNWLDLLPENLRFFRSRATPEMAHLPYALIHDLFADRFGILESDSGPVVRQKLETGIAGFLGGGEPGVVGAHFIGQLLGFDFSASPHLRGVLDNAQQLTQRALHYLGEFFTRALAAVPALGLPAVQGIVIFLEDLHWADEKSLELVTHLIQAQPTLKLMLVCLARPTFLERQPPWGHTLPHHFYLQLQPLSQAASQQLVEEILNKVSDMPIAFRDLIVQSAEGNPFYVEELIKMLIEDGVILKAEEQWRVEPHRLAEFRVPPTLTGVLQARLDSLPPAERSILQKASVVGRVFWDQVVGQLSDDNALTETTLAAGLEALCRRELIFKRSEPDFVGTQEYTFKHAVLRDVTYESVLKRARRAYHRQVAHWLHAAAQRSQREQEYLGRIGEHFERAGEVPLAVEYLSRAGDQAYQISAFQSAQNFFERALALAQSPEAGWDAAPHWQIRLTRQVGEAFWRVGDFATAKTRLEESVALAEAAQDAPGLAEALVQVGRLAYDQGAIAEAQTRLDAGLTIARQIDHAPTIASALIYLGYLAAGRGEHQTARQLYEESLALRKTLGNVSDIAGALNSLGNVLSQLQDLPAAKAYYEESLALQRSIGNRYGMSIPLYNLGEIVLEEKNYAQARDYFMASLELTKEIQNRFGLVYNYAALGQVAYAADDLPEARRYLHEALAIAFDIGALRQAMANLHLLAQVWVKEGQLEPAAELLGFMAQHPASERTVQQDIEARLTEIRQHLEPTVVLAALQRGAGLTLEAVKARVLQ